MADHRSALKFELQELLLVALGAVPGALLRWQFALHLADQNLVANTLGVGFCGSLTTFSSWMLDAVRQLGVGEIKAAAGLIGLTLGLGLGAAALGFQLGRKIRPPGPPRSGL